MKNVKVGIIGTGNIGTDLLIKIQRSNILKCEIFTGINPDSEGIALANYLGIPTSTSSIKVIQENPGCCDIVFDATSASIHMYNAPILEDLKKFTIDLTPSQIGKMCVPAINIGDCLDSNNVNLITCGGQATIPVIKAVTKVHPETEYIEIVSSISSRSAGTGTRANIDEFTQTTRDAIASFSSVKKTKAIIVLNPADPPVLMHNTIYAKINNPDIERLRIEVAAMAQKIQKYVPGYMIKIEPVFENNRVTTVIEVVGLGDYLPKYSGNLDIMTCAAINVAEEYAKRSL